MVASFRQARRLEIDVFNKNHGFEGDATRDQASVSGDTIIHSNTNVVGEHRPTGLTSCLRNGVMDEWIRSRSRIANRPNDGNWLIDAFMATSKPCLPVTACRCAATTFRRRSPWFEQLLEHRIYKRMVYLLHQLFSMLEERSPKHS